MKLITTFGLLAFICYLHYSLALDSTQVKIIKYKGDFANSSYVNTDLGELKVIKVNETYNRVYLKADIIQEFPLNTTFTVVVYRSKSIHGPWSYVDVYHTLICDKNDKNRDHLPYNLLSMSRTDGKSCVQKGHYEYNDAGIFQYCEVIPGGQGYYYKQVNIIESDDITISVTRAWSKWGNVTSNQ